MITVLTGENSFEVERALRSITQAFDGVAEKIDGEELDLKTLPDLLMGGTLFASRRLVIIKNLSENKAIWADFGEWLPRISDDTQLVLVEPKPDKRTKTYKLLKDQAEVREYATWKEGDTRTAEQWVSDEVKRRKMILDSASIRTLVAWVGIDQWQLHFALEKLAVLDAVTPEIIREVTEAAPTENVFHVFETALRGDHVSLRRLLVTLEHSEDGYRLFGLLANQAYQLAALAVADQPAADVARALGVHPYALSKMQSHADRLGRAGVRRIIHRLAEADHRLKTGSDDVWLVLETALMAIAR